MALFLFLDNLKLFGFFELLNPIILYKAQDIRLQLIGEVQ
jgi:hypothetical protein